MCLAISFDALYLNNFHALSPMLLRYSGDFSFFNHNSSSKNVNLVASKLSGNSMQDVIEGDRSSSEKESEGMKDGGGDWAYITFPNGVPTVREIKTNGGAQTNGSGAPNIVQRDPDVTNVANGIKKAQPVKVVTKNVPGVSIPFNNCQQELSSSYKYYFLGNFATFP